MLTISKVDFDESLQQHRTVVKHGVSEELDEQKRLYEGISDLLSEVARDIAGNVPAGLVDNLNVIYFPQIGFLIAMPMDPEIGRALWEGDGEDAWERMFSSDTIVYYKNYQMTEMDEWFGDIYGEICGKVFVRSLQMLCFETYRDVQIGRLRLFTSWRSESWSLKTCFRQLLMYAGSWIGELCKILISNVLMAFGVSWL